MECLADVGEDGIDQIMCVAYNQKSKFDALQARVLQMSKKPGCGEECDCVFGFFGGVVCLNEEASRELAKCA